MSLPQPSVALTGACSVLFNDTLYAYTPSAFQALSLSSGAEWEELSYGESVTGGVCVGSTPADASQAGLYVVGGSSSNSSYYGLQKYTYTTGQWESIVPETSVTQDRLYHGAVYISDSDVILIYAGSQDGSTGESTQTFTVGASYPYSVLSFQSSAPPTKSPILLPWSSSEAAVVGGSVTNTAVYLFNPASGWTNSGTTLASALTKDTASIQAALVTGDDTSKNMYVFDLSVSPNEVSRMVLLDANSQPVTSSAAVKRSLLDDSWVSEEEYEVQKRDNSTTSLTLDTWPAYNSSLAPTVARSGYCMAAGTSGTIIAAGGTSSEDVLCMFDGRTNAWQNATQVFATHENSFQSSDTSSSVSASASASATSTPTSTSSTTAATSSAASSTTAAAAAAAADSVSGTSSGAILGAVLGSVSGAIVILFVAFLLVVRRRKQPPPKAGEQDRHNSQGTSSEKDSYDVTSSNSMPRPIGGGGPTFRNGHQAQDSQGSFSSVAILMGRVNQPRSPTVVRPGNLGDLKDTSAGIPSKGLKGQISKPIPQTMSNLGAAAVPQSAKFEEANLDVSYTRNITPARLNEDQAGRQSSIRRSSGWNRYWSGGSALNILGFGNGGGNNSNRRSANRATMVSDVSSNYSVTEQHPHRITQDSATVPPLDIPMMPDARPRFQRVNSGSPTVSGFNNAFKDGLQGKIERSLSNGSSRSGYSSGIPASVHEAWDPTGYDDKPWGADRVPSSTYSTTTSGVYNANSLAPPAAAAGGKKTPVTSGMSRQPQLATASTSSDMSWLNLGGASRV